MKIELNAIEQAQLGALFDQKNYEKAQEYAQMLTVQFPDCVESWKALATAFQFQNKKQQAFETVQKAEGLFTDDAELKNNLGLLLAQRGDIELAEQYFQKAIALDSTHADFYANLARLYVQTARFAQAKKQFQQAITRNPYYARAREELADIYFDEGEFHDAILHYEKAIFSNPNNAVLHNKLGTVFRELSDFKKAGVHYQKAIEISPDFAHAYSNFGILLKKIKRLDEAQMFLKTAIELRPDIPELYNNLANVMVEMGEIEEAEKLFLHALEKNPDCLKTYDNFLFIANHNPKHSPQDCLAFAKRFGEMATQAASCHFSHEIKKQNLSLRLKIGVVSGDLREHPVSYFLELLFKALGEGEFELFAYPTTFKQDETTQRFKTYFSHWKPIANLDDETAATLIYDDGIHILLDLAGHTAKNRLPVFAFKPAPIQISWLGYPATTGLQEIDFYLVDEDWCPHGMMDEWFTEKLLRLKVTAGTFYIPDDIPEISDAPCLKNGYITFGSFNRTAKISDETFDLWCNVLKAIPNAKMLLGNVSNEKLQQRLQIEFETRGVNVERLIFYPRLNINAYLKLHAQIDVILDTSPYAGGTTSAFAILMGVPVLTLAGQTLVSRVGVTILRAVGLKNDFVAHSTQQFIERAIHWANSPQMLQKLRLELRERVKNSQQCNPNNVAREIEKTFKELWTQFCSPLKTKHF